jgi:formylglycine-generating enzyme required for sulfatase activity
MLTTFALFAAAALPPQAPAAGKAKKALPPPGLIEIKGGRTKIGTDAKTVEEMVKNGGSIHHLSTETPQHEVTLPDFYFMVTEVTCEQYAAFVRATGYRPPEDWAAQAIDQASREYAEKVGEAKKKAKEEGKPIPDADKFVRSHWWRENWQGKPWEVPKDAATRPVVYVDYTDAQAYARWAGLRLPTEFEFQRAGRGNTDNVYPWGNDRDPTRAAVQELRVNGKEVRPSAPLPVANFVQGSVGGLFDLSGNVWEWTSSPFVAYPGHKQLKITLGAGAQKKEELSLVDWRADLKVVVGGSFENNFVAGRLTARRATDPMQSTGGMGFRCAAGVDPGVDVASLMLMNDLPPGTRPQDVVFDVNRVVPIESWTSSAGTASMMEKPGERVPVPGYAIIESYENVLYVPSDKIEAITVDRMTELSHRNGTVTMGVLSTTRSLSWPPLEKGTYVVAFRGPGEPVKTMADIEKEAREEGKPTEANGTKPPPKQDDSIGLGYPPPLELPKDAAHFVFFTPEGQAKAWIPAPSMTYMNLGAPKVTIVDTQRQWQTKDEATGKVDMHSEDATKVTIQVSSGVQASNKGISYPLELYFAPGTVGASWRHP